MNKFEPEIQQILVGASLVHFFFFFLTPQPGAVEEAHWILCLSVSAEVEGSDKILEWFKLTCRKCSRPSAYRWNGNKLS